MYLSYTPQNNARFFTYFEQARLKHCAACDFELDSSAKIAMPVLSSTSARFRAQLAYPCDIVVGISTGNITENSLTQSFAVFNTGTGRVVAEGEAELVFINFSTGKRAPIPKSYLEKAIAIQDGKTSLL